MGYPRGVIGPWPNLTSAPRVTKAAARARPPLEVLRLCSPCFGLGTRRRVRRGADAPPGHRIGTTRLPVFLLRR
jgi:hypothetical protein